MRMATAYLILGGVWGRKTELFTDADVHRKAMGKVGYANEVLQQFYIVFSSAELRRFGDPITIGPPEILFTVHSTIVLEEVLCASQKTHAQYAFNGFSASRS
jgi:hypothetical protein